MLTDLIKALLKVREKSTRAVKMLLLSNLESE